MALSLGNLRLEVLDELVALLVHKPEMDQGDYKGKYEKLGFKLLVHNKGFVQQELSFYVAFICSFFVFC